MQEGGTTAWNTAVDITAELSSGVPRFRDPKVERSVWDRVVDTASEYNQPGTFTAFNGYEYSSTEDGNNLHRVVIFRDGPDRAGSRYRPRTSPRHRRSSASRRTAASRTPPSTSHRSAPRRPRESHASRTRADWSPAQVRSGVSAIEAGTTDPHARLNRPGCDRGSVRNSALVACRVAQGGFP